MWRRLRNARLVVLVALLSGLLAACGAPGLGSTGSSDTITFGATISITGQTAKEGEYTRDGYQFFIDTINQRGGITVGNRTYKVKLRYYDDESRPARTAELYEKLIKEDQVNFLLGPYGSGPTAAAAPIAEKYEMPMVAANGSAGSIYAKGYRYIFNVQTPAKNYLRGVIDAVLVKDPTVKTIAILSKDEPFSAEVAAGVVEYAEEKQLEVVYNQSYPSNTQDVSVLLTNVKAQNPDILLGAGHLQDSLLIVRQAKNLDVTPKAIGFSVGPSSPEFRENLKEDADYIFGSTQWTSALHYTGTDVWGTPAAFAAAFMAKYPHYKSVPYQVAESTAALVVFQQALEQADTLDPQKVRDMLAGLETTTFFGPIKFDKRGVNSSKPMAVEQWQPDGKKYTVFPVDVAENEIMYPMPPWHTR